MKPVASSIAIDRINGVDTSGRLDQYPCFIVGYFSLIFLTCKLGYWRRALEIGLWGRLGDPLRRKARL